MDSTLRDLQRHWRNSGSVEAGVAYIRAALRSSVLDRQDVELAALLGDMSAVQVSGREPAEDIENEYSELLTPALARLSQRKVAIFSIACAYRAIPVWLEICPGDSTMEKLLEAAEELLDGKQTLEQLKQASTAAVRVFIQIDPSGSGSPSLELELGRYAADSILNASGTVNPVLSEGEDPTEALLGYAAGAADLGSQSFYLEKRTEERAWQKRLLSQMLLGCE